MSGFLQYCMSTLSLIPIAFASSHQFLLTGHSKVLNILWTKSLQQRFDKAEPPVPITVIAIHPGGVDTFSHNWPLPWLMKPLVGLAINSPEMGSYTSVFAAASKKVREEKSKYKAAYLESHPPGHFAKPSKEAQNEKLAEDLWKLTEQYLEGLGV